MAVLGVNPKASTLFTDSNGENGFTIDIKNAEALQTPDSRFATTFLSTKYRNYAVDGEAIMDKVSGELFVKRPADGRVVSFSQNKKYIHDTVFEFGVAITNYTDFLFPFHNDNAFYLSTDYDLTAINNETPFNILTGDIHIDNDSANIYNHLYFNLSKETNGFFCKPMTRDCDKAMIEFLTNEYNRLIKSYTGKNSVYTAERAKLMTNDDYKLYNATLYYTVVATNGTTTKTYDKTAYICINEETPGWISLAEILKDFPDGVKKTTIKINDIKFEKIRFLLNHQNELEDEFSMDASIHFFEGFEKFKSPDGNINLNNFNVMHFVDDSKDIELLNNEFLIAALDMPYMLRYMNKLNSIREHGNIIISTARPTDAEWSNNTLWAERVRDIDKNGVMTNVSDTNLTELEAYLAESDTIYGNITTDAEKDNFFLLVDVTS